MRTIIHYRAVLGFPFPLSVLAPLVLRRAVEKLADETIASITGVLQPLS